jgi:(R,R)-butanediol dehydrogenase/meso-butanediol dehydrogenase/diacetyl reductase
MSGHYHRCSHRTETGILNRSGAFAEQITLPATFLHKISSAVPFRSAALVEPTAVAFNGVRRAEVSPCDQVAIFGDGPIGLLLLQIVRLHGARRVVVVGAADKRLALARELGADDVVDARSDDVARKVQEGCGGVLPEVVFEASGNPDAIKSSIASTAPGGRLVLQGFCGGRRVDGLNVDPIIVNDLTVMGALGSPGVWPDVIRLIESRRLNPGLIVTDELPVREFSEAIRRVEKREAVKVVLRTDSEAAWS